MSARTRFSLPNRIPPPQSKPLKTIPSWGTFRKTFEKSNIIRSQSSENPFTFHQQATHEKLTDFPSQTCENPFVTQQEEHEEWSDIPPQIPKQPEFSVFTHVALPNIVEDDDGGYSYVRWEVIKDEIHKMKRDVREGGDVGDAIKYCILAYNDELVCSFGVLYEMIKVATDLFGDGEVREVVQFIGDACLGVDRITHGVKLLSGVEGGGVERVELGRLEIVTLLACGFMCMYPGRDGKCQVYAEYPQINFDGLFDDKYRNAWGWGVWICCKKSKVHRLLCIFNYFRRIHERVCSGDLDNSKVSYERRTLSFDDTPEWGGWMRHKFCDLEIHEHGILEDSTGCLQVDFANKFVGGATLGHGIRMEEIMFSQSPELIACQVFTKVLRDNECVVVGGVERFSVTEGYGTGFRYVGEYFDERGSRVGVMDAVKFERNSLGVQLGRSWVDRELTKCFVTFKGEVFVASGKWGAGVFNGDPLLKCIIQWIGASVAGVTGLELYTFGDTHLSDQLNQILKYVRQRDWCVGKFYNLLVGFGESLGGRSVSTSELFEFICSEVSTDVKEFGVDNADELVGIGGSAKWYVVELVCRTAMAWKGVGGVVAVGAILGWVGQQWVVWGRDLLQ